MACFLPRGFSPLLADAEGVLSLDTRVILSEPRPAV